MSPKDASFIITGDEDEYKSIRYKVVNHMCNEIHEEMNQTTTI